MFLVFVKLKSIRINNTINFIPWSIRGFAIDWFVFVFSAQYTFLFYII